MTLFTLALFLVPGCTGGPEAREAVRYAALHLCPEQRPQACTMEYLPVCALLDSGSRKEFASACSACSDAAVVGYDPDTCP